MQVTAKLSVSHVEASGYMKWKLLPHVSRCRHSTETPGHTSDWESLTGAKERVCWLGVTGVCEARPHSPINWLRQAVT